MPDSTLLLAAGLAVAYGVLLLLSLQRSREQARQGTRTWLRLTLLAALAGAALYALPADAHTDTQYEALFPGELTQPALAIIAINLMLVAFGSQLLRYIGSRLSLVWTVIGLAWWVAGAVSSATTATDIGQDGWITSIYDPVEVPTVLAFGGWLVLGVVLLLAALYAFYRARLPEIANQALFGGLLVPPVFFGAGLGASGVDVLAELGWVLQWIGLVGAVYAVRTYRILDLRRTARHAAATAMLTVVTALVVFGALVAAQELDANTEGLYAILAGLALGVAILYVPLRTVVGAVAARLVGAPNLSESQLLREYSQAISGVVELDALIDVTMQTLQRALRVRRAGLIVTSKRATVYNTTQHGSDQGVVLEPLPRGLGEMPAIKVRLGRETPIGQQFLERRAPLLQYDLDYGAAYAGTPTDERAFFQQMHMSVYAPVIFQDQLVGVLCCGPKSSDAPFTEHDLELLMTVASQAAVGLRNARLVADLRRRETELSKLNQTLQTTQVQLQKLDSVKTDFITIASHELRTPLAQIRGYTDILEAMNESGMLEQDQVSGMTNNLRKAADRLEELIGAMLDVSQLDVNALDLRFAPTGLENVLRMAIEPLNESIRNRKLMLSARGLRDLPQIQGDMQRLVQAFRNVILNAIKFTPDGGRIDITGERKNGEIVIRIQDSGIGIDPANRELVFEKFYRAHDPSLHSTGATKFMGAGPGLGLTIAKGVIDGHGGRIWVESTGHDPESCPGSTFYIALPLSPPSDPAHDPILDTGSISLSAMDIPAEWREALRGDGDAAPDGHTPHDGDGAPASSGDAPAAAPESHPTLVRPPDGLADWTGSG